jgi:hypothetical protein
MNGIERRAYPRIRLDHRIPAQMMAIDGTWRRACRMDNVSETGAKLTIDGSIEGLQLKEFFLLLSSAGVAYRRCRLTWVNGDRIGVTFLRRGKKAVPQPDARDTPVG